MSLFGPKFRPRTLPGNYGLARAIDTTDNKSVHVHIGHRRQLTSNGTTNQANPAIPTVNTQDKVRQTLPEGQSQPLQQHVPRSVPIPIQDSPTRRARPLTHTQVRQALRTGNATTLVTTPSRGKEPANLDNTRAVPSRLIRDHPHEIGKRPPSHRASQGMVPHHALHVQVLQANHVLALDKTPGQLMTKIGTSIPQPLVQASNLPPLFLIIPTFPQIPPMLQQASPLLPELPLLLFELPLKLFIIVRIVIRDTISASQERVNTKVSAEDAVWLTILDVPWLWYLSDRSYRE